ncbi:MAG: anthranilate phosphoribosyltransferase [Planctomycetota bacterium]
MRELLSKLIGGEHLTAEETRWAFEQIMSGTAEPIAVGALLAGLACRGPAASELVGAATVMREKARKINAGDFDPVLDTCGTGGDVTGTFNISTAAALIAAAAGVKVVKHGNRSASSKSGSADVLECLGVYLDAPSHVERQCLEEANICFAFARNHHPAMRNVAEIRQKLGVPTLFNLLGPLTNPGGAGYQLLGVFAPDLTEIMAHALKELGTKRAWVCHGHSGLDELSTLSRTQISEVRDGQVTTWTLDPADLGLKTPELSDLQVDGPAASAKAIEAIFEGETGPRRDIALLNAAGALVVVGKANDLADGMTQAAATIDDGRAKATLQALIRASK